MQTWEAGRLSGDLRQAVRRNRGMACMGDGGKGWVYHNAVVLRESVPVENEDQEALKVVSCRSAAENVGQSTRQLRFPYSFFSHKPDRMSQTSELESHDDEQFLSSRGKV